MAQARQLERVLDRVADGRATSADLAWLRDRMHVGGRGHTVQLGKYNVPIQHGRDIHIGDRIYHGGDADAIVDVLEELTGRGRLRGVGGVISTVGMLMAMGGLLYFFYGIAMEMTSDPFSGDFGPPREIIVGFGVGAVGVVIGGIGGIVSAWQRDRGR